MELAACCKMLSLVRFAASPATSASLIRDSAALKFSLATVSTFVATSILA